jgi:hypothetical protein
LSDDIRFSVAEDNNRLGAIGRPLDRLANRWQVRRVLCMPEPSIEFATLAEEQQLVLALGNDVKANSFKSNQLTGHMGYIGFLLSEGLNASPFWSVTNNTEWLVSHLRYNRWKECNGFSSDESWTGTPNPKVVFVGDANSPIQKARIYNYPMTGYDNTFYYFNMAMNLAGINEDIVGIVDGSKPGGRESLVYYSTLPAIPVFVALGNLSDEILDELNIPHEKLPHPQFIKRFNQDRLGNYASQLAQIRSLIV